MPPLDAVLVVPGIMGSELVDTETGKVLWGLSDLNFYVRAWTSSAWLDIMRTTEDERTGRYGRVRATRLLRFPAAAPVLRGFEPYTKLIRGLRLSSIHPDAVAEFPYDWRLPISHNSELLAEAAKRHLYRWRRHPAYYAARRRAPANEAKLVIVAHSMGGLVALGMNHTPGALDDVRATISLGTPFFGSIKAAILLNSGAGLPVLPRRGIRELAATFPGIHYLLPRNRCVDLGIDARRLLPSDIARLGGDEDLAVASAQWHDSLEGLSLPGHRQIVGVRQPTPQSITIDEGVVTAHTYTCHPSDGGGIERVDVAGDGTVSRESARLRNLEVVPLAQSHGALAKSDEALLIAEDLMADRRTGPWLGDGGIGVACPDLATVGQPFEVAVTDVDHPRDVSGWIQDAGTGRQIGLLQPELLDGQIRCRVRLPRPGLYRIAVAGGGLSAVSELIIAGEATG